MPRASAVYPKFAYDNLLLLKDAGLVTTTAAGTVAASARILDLGSNSYHSGHVVIEATAIDTGANASYRISLQGSASPTFASGNFDLGSLLLGVAAVVPQGANSVTGQYTFPFSTEYASTTFRYARIFHTISGTITTGINYTAFLSI